MDYKITFSDQLDAGDFGFAIAIKYPLFWEELHDFAETHFPSNDPDFEIDDPAELDENDAKVFWALHDAAENYVAVRISHQLDCIRWLIEGEHEFELFGGSANFEEDTLTLYVTIPSAKSASLFKLTWGGN
ncbi:hypothetical protein ACIGGE_10725 [Qipengyuania sp. NPDC077410]|uniref:hypothetical protein n=1 Tax=Qipengyuania sp. NPDC077410 TaxID=3364496 RepID=UPI0037CC2CC0